MRVGRVLLLVPMLAILSGCYRQVVNTGRTPSATTVSRPWTATWVFGLVAAKPIDVTQNCPAGIATVTTQMTVPNWLAQAVTLSIYAPRNVTVTCAQGTAMSGAQTIHVARGASDAAFRKALETAAQLAADTGEPVVLRF